MLTKEKIEAMVDKFDTVDIDDPAEMIECIMHCYTDFYHKEDGDISNYVQTVLAHYADEHMLAERDAGRIAIEVVMQALAQALAKSISQSIKFSYMTLSDVPDLMEEIVAQIGIEHARPESSYEECECCNHEEGESNVVPIRPTKH